MIFHSSHIRVDSLPSTFCFSLISCIYFLLSVNYFVSLADYSFQWVVIRFAVMISLLGFAFPFMCIYIYIYICSTALPCKKRIKEVEVHFFSFLWVLFSFLPSGIFLIWYQSQSIGLNFILFFLSWLLHNPWLLDLKIYLQVPSIFIPMETPL